MKIFAIALFVFALATQITAAQDRENEEDVWEPLRPLVGRWVGERTGLGGDAKQTVKWEFVLGNQFLRCTTDSKSESDPHEDIGFLSYDKSRKQFVYRAFFSEGFVNQYVVNISDDGNTLEFHSEAVENGPPGLRAREVIKLDGNKIHQEFSLASGDKPWQVCVKADLKKQK